jgi:hypothetical protein
MKKYSIRLDLTKIDKSKIKDTEFTTKDGTVVKQKTYDMDFVFLNTPKVIKTTDRYQMVKNAFISDPSVKNADGTYTNGTILGDAFDFINVDNGSAVVEASNSQPVTGRGMDITEEFTGKADESSIPF